MQELSKQEESQIPSESSDSFELPSEVRKGRSQ